MASAKRRLKGVLAALPFTAELDWYLRHRGEAARGFSLDKLEPVLAEWHAQAAASPFKHSRGKRVLLYGTQRYWIEYAALLGLAFAGLGHKVTLAYSPFADWRVPVSAYDLRQHNLYAKGVMRQAEPLLETLSFADAPRTSRLPPVLTEQIADLSLRDAQYTLQVEEIAWDDALYHLRLARNTAAAEAALGWLQANPTDIVIVPNGLILEMGAVFLSAKHLKIPTVSYEFGEQRGRIWLSQDAPVMIQETGGLWSARKDQPFGEEEMERIQALYAARTGAGLYQHFYRYWQNLPSEGSAQARVKLGLDDRPIVLLAANVIGDSLTLGRQVFTDTMTEWLVKTLEYFASQTQAQFVLRTHPGEKNLPGPSVMDIVARVLPTLPTHMRAVGPEEEINTYDIISIADLGLAYTTTVGMEMAMSGVPVIVLGRTHYRNKGFTLDPASWEDYYRMVEEVLAAPTKLSEEQVRTAWHYAYRFFFDYPHDFPWHLIHFWDNVDEWPLRDVLTEAGLAAYGRTFDFLLGEPLTWDGKQR